MDEAPLLELRDVWRSYPAGEDTIDALKGVNLAIQAGEMVAIIGASGSGKSTLMNILGCLDRPTRGRYKVAGRDVKTLLPDDLAKLRREHFGFIFQRYHLLADLDARDNVEVPAIYAGRSAKDRRDRASALLGRLGLTDRMGHKPNQLSGGQQQRVSVARALMNGGEIILADEPTGALDTRSGAEMMNILRELNAEGHTIILVTHDPKVAANARRVIEISDGEIVADRVNPEAPAAPEGKAKARPIGGKEAWTAGLDRVGDAFRMAVLAMNAHRLRTILTMLGIIIGIASVVTIFAIGAGAQKSILSSVANIGSDTITILPGTGRGDPRAQTVRTLRPSDVDALSRLSYVDSVTPQVSAARTLRLGSFSGMGNVAGVGEGFFRVQNQKIAKGRFFDAEAVKQAAQVAVIDDNTARKVFPDAEPIGQVILLGDTPVRVIGVTAKPEGLAGLAIGETLQVWVPYTTVMNRMVKQPDLRTITVRVAEGASVQGAEEAITRLLTTRHGKTDFFLITSDAIGRQVGQITTIFSALLGSIGGISLVVGGIGVMNIMLVSVSERIREIGVRTAVGARRSDIMSQFMIEAVLVCLIGGGIGVGLAMGIGAVFGLFVKSFTLVYSPVTILAAFTISTLIGLVFGWLPARNAANLDPVEALARE